MANKQMHHLKVGDNIFEIVDSVARSGISGAPSIVSLSSAMIDTSKLYLYIGSETGYTSGNWYYHNGTSWVSGGQYGDMQLDTSLTTSGMAADAKSVGDRFNNFATTATAGQAPIADGQGGWVWGDVEADTIPASVRQAIAMLFTKVFYMETGVDDEVAVIQSWATEITAISVNPTTLSLSGSTPSTITAVTSPAGGAVTWSSSNTAVATVSGGVVTGVSNGTCTITASCGGKSASCTVTVSGFATLTGISAVYTQSETVYDTDSLSDLTSDLVVTASYDNSTTATLASSQYTLSGTLTKGTRTITVSYGGYTDTFDVRVTENVGTLLYDWDFTNNNLTDYVEGLVAQTTATQGSNGITFDSASKYIALNTAEKMSCLSKRIEIDVASMSDARTTGYARLFNVTTSAAYATNNNSDSFLWKNDGTGWYVYNGSFSTESLSSNTYPGSYFNGKTIALIISPTGEVTVSVDGTDLITYTSKKFSKTGYFVLGGSNYDYLNYLSVTISGVRIYEVL